MIWHERTYSARCWIMDHLAGLVLPGNFLKIHFQGLPSFLYTRRRCSSISSHAIFFFGLTPSCSSSVRHPSSSLLASKSLPLRLSPSLVPAVCVSPQQPIQVGHARIGFMLRGWYGCARSQQAAKQEIGRGMIAMPVKRSDSCRDLI